MERPYQTERNMKRGTSTLFFPDGTSAEFYLRGGICWPIMVEHSESRDFEGFALMVGFKLKTDEYFVFEQQSFVTIHHIVWQQKIAFEGIAPWFNMVWSRYYANCYYWHQEEELNRRYMLEIVRSPIIFPKPELPDLPWTNDQEAQLIVWQKVKIGQVIFPKDSRIHRELELVKKKEAETTPAVHALQCALMGMERYPFNRHMVDDD